MAEINYVCQYCDRKFKLTRFWGGGTEECPDCGDTNIKPLKDEEENRNPFGYED